LIFILFSSAAGDFTTDGLVAHLAFEEDSGSTSTDLTGNGHNAGLVGTSWSAGHVSVPYGDPSAMISVTTASWMRSQSFTWDLWFEAGQPSRHGRICAQTESIGKIGPEILAPGISEHPAVRINNAGAVFNEPTIGTRSSEGPPDHWGTAADKFHRGDGGSEHLILTHDANSKTVRMFIGLKDRTLKLTFEATYTGSYAVGSAPLVIGNNPTADRAFPLKCYQFSCYDRALTFQADGNRNVTGGEVYENHLAGDAVELSPVGIGISDSGHYVTYKGETLMLIGDSGTQCVAQNANLNHRDWIDDCADRGIRAIHVWSFVAVRQKQDGSQIENRWGYIIPDVVPWARKTSGPLAYDQRYQWDLQTFDEGPKKDMTHYWPRLRDLCSYAKSKNMLVGVSMFTGWSKHDYSWVYHPLNISNGGHLTNKKDAVIIDTPGTEVWQESWSDSWSNARKTQWVWEQLSIKSINELGSLGNVFFVFFDEHSYSEGNMGDHFRDFFRNRGMLWIDWGQRRDSVDMVYDQFLMRPNKNSRLEAQFGKTPIRPFFGFEEGGASGFNYTSDLLEMVWRYSMAGGHYFHHNDERQETVTTGIMVYDPKTKPSGNKDKVLERLTWLGNASRFFNEHIDELDSMTPHNDLSSSGTYCLANPGREYVVYSKIGSAANFTVNLSAAADKTLNCRFYNPQNGVFKSTFQRAGGSSSESFTKPDSNDWVLHILED